MNHGETSPDPSASSNMTCRVLPHRRAEGPWQMAADEALLDSVTADRSGAIVRTYEWSQPTLSLGYFQSIAEVEADVRWSSVAIVRRPTGGGALWHDREITYAVVVPADHPSARPSRTLYRTIHRAIAEELRRSGVPARLRGESEVASMLASRPFLCFADRDDDDVVVGPFKVVGSAQRRRAGAVLQHGSLLFRRSPTTPELPGLADLTPLSDSAPRWADKLREILPKALGLDPRPDDFTAGESARISGFVDLAYSQDSWTRRR